jgi:hypothetical protein
MSLEKPEQPTIWNGWSSYQPNKDVYFERPNKYIYDNQ